MLAAAVHHFGTRDGRVPARPFTSPTRAGRPSLGACSITSGSRSSADRARFARLVPVGSRACLVTVPPTIPSRSFALSNDRRWGNQSQSISPRSIIPEMEILLPGMSGLSAQIGRISGSAPRLAAWLIAMPFSAHERPSASVMKTAPGGRHASTPLPIVRGHSPSDHVSRDTRSVLPALSDAARSASRTSAATCRSSSTSEDGSGAQAALAIMETTVAASILTFMATPFRPVPER